MTGDGGMFPSDFIGVLPQFNFSVVRGRGDEVSGGMEADPVASSFMSIEYFDALDFYSNKGTEIFGLC